jgi:hypothetical protein
MIGTQQRFEWSTSPNLYQQPIAPLPVGGQVGQIGREQVANLAHSILRNRCQLGSRP